MASKNQPADLDGFDEPSVSQDDTSSGSIDLDPGEHLIGTITAYKPWAGSNGLVEIDGQVLWLNRTMHQQLISSLVEGQTVAHVKSDEQESFTDSDGEEQTYYPRSLRFQAGGDDS